MWIMRGAVGQRLFAHRASGRLRRFAVAAPLMRRRRRVAHRLRTAGDRASGGDLLLHRLSELR